MLVHTSRAWSWALPSALAVGCSLLLAACGGDSAAAESAESRPVSTAAERTALRYATAERVAIEELIAAPYTLVIDADDEAAVTSGLQLADTVHTFAGGKTAFGVYVRSRHPALAERLAERLTTEQGWEHVFVVR